MRKRPMKGSSQKVATPEEKVKGQLGLATWGAYYSELDKAMDRLGNTPVKVMEWILRFDQENLGTISEGDWTNRRYELAEFTQYGALGRKSFEKEKVISIPSWSSMAPKSEIPENPNEIQLWYVQQLPGKRAAKELQKITHECLKEHLENGTTSFPLSGATIHTGYDKERDLGFKFILSNNPKTMFGYYLSSFIAQHSGRIRRCAGCPIIFLADRKNQIYHSSQCQSRINMRRKRNTPPDRIGKRGRPPKKAQDN